MKFIKNDVKYLKIFRVFVYNVTKNDYNKDEGRRKTMCFPKRLKELRLAHGETQRDLANAIEVGRTTISEYESGKIVPKQEGLLRIANHFNVSVDYLTGVSDNPATRKQNASDLDALLNTIHHILLDEYDTPVTYEGEQLSSRQKIIIDQLIEQLRDNIEMMLELKV